MSCSGLDLQRSIDKCVFKTEGQRPEGSGKQNMSNRYGIWSCLSQRKENVGATWMSSNIWSTFNGEGRRHSCFSWQQNWIHVDSQIFFFFYKLARALCHVVPGVRIIFHLFASSKQLVVTIWNTVFGRILRMRLSSPGTKNAVTDRDVCCGRKGPLRHKCHVLCHWYRP